MTKAFQDSVQSHDRQLAWCRDFDADGTTASCVIDDEAGLNTRTADTPIATAPRKVIVRGQRPAMAECHFEV